MMYCNTCRGRVRSDWISRTNFSPIFQKKKKDIFPFLKYPKKKKKKNQLERPNIGNMKGKGVIWNRVVLQRWSPAMASSTCTLTTCAWTPASNTPLYPLNSASSPPRSPPPETAWSGSPSPTPPATSSSRPTPVSPRSSPSWTEPPCPPQSRQNSASSSGTWRTRCPFPGPRPHLEPKISAPCAATENSPRRRRAPPAWAPPPW